MVQYESNSCVLLFVKAVVDWSISSQSPALTNVKDKDKAVVDWLILSLSDDVNWLTLSLSDDVIRQRDDAI